MVVDERMQLTSIVVNLAANELGNFTLSHTTDDISCTIDDSTVLLDLSRLEARERTIGTLLSALDDGGIANDLAVV